VAKLTIVAPTITLGIPLFSEIETADSTNQSAPLVIINKLSMKSIIVIRIMSEYDIPTLDLK
jgi:hypothetical protein